METLLIIFIIVAVIAIILAIFSFFAVFSRSNNSCCGRRDDDVRYTRVNADINGVIQLANNTSEPLNIVNSNGEIVARISNGNVRCLSNNNNSCCCRR